MEKIWLFGSRARGDNAERSDIDLAFSCPLATTEDWQKLMHVIDDADTLLKIDAIRFETLKESSAIRNSILAEGIIIYEK